MEPHFDDNWALAGRCDLPAYAVGNDAAGRVGLTQRSNLAAPGRADQLARRRRVGVLGDGDARGAGDAGVLMILDVVGIVVIALLHRHHAGIRRCGDGMRIRICRRRVRGDVSVRARRELNIGVRGRCRRRAPRRRNPAGRRVGGRRGAATAATATAVDVDHPPRWKGEVGRGGARPGASTSAAAACTEVVGVAEAVPVGVVYVHHVIDRIQGQAQDGAGRPMPHRDLADAVPVDGWGPDDLIGTAVGPARPERRQGASGLRLRRRPQVVMHLGGLPQVEHQAEEALGRGEQFQISPEAPYRRSWLLD